MSTTDKINPYAPFTKKQEVAYDNAISAIRNKLGSYDKIGQLLFDLTKTHVSYQTIRTWFALRAVPEQVVIALFELTDGGFDAFDLMPWMREFFEKRIYPQIIDGDWDD